MVGESELYANVCDVNEHDVGIRYVRADERLYVGYPRCSLPARGHEDLGHTEFLVVDKQNSAMCFQVID